MNDDTNIVDLRLHTKAAETAFSDTDIANAKRLAERRHEDIRYTTAWGWLVWDGIRWCEDEKDVLIQALAKETAVAIFDEIRAAPDREAMMRHARRSQSKSSVDNMISLARSEPGLCIQLTDFDTDPFLLNVQNGTLELHTGILREHRRQDLLTKLVPISYDEKAKCPLWISFLRRVTDNDDGLMGYLKRFVGYVLTGDTSEQVLHFIFGLGSNGKTVFVEVLNLLLGSYAIVISPELLMIKRHGGIPNDIARLRGVRLAAMNETSQGARFDESKVKDLTGGDRQTARFLHREYFDFNPTHKLAIRGNYKPTICGTDEGIWRRLRLVLFKVQIQETEKDPHLLDKLRAELPGILRWAVQGCLEWQNDGLQPPECVLAAVKKYRQDSDTLGRFIGESCTLRQLAQVKSSSFYTRYQKFCETAGERWISSKDLPAEMERREFEHKATNVGKFYFGIELNLPEDYLP
ncbi:MAG TPA: phage/plasmid primase, P4 family [Gammaproteobacteria bacterium]|nr:phage/plasmid primase, P4 family [Gammaproteobacteria bacterium]